MCGGFIDPFVSKGENNRMRRLDHPLVVIPLGAALIMVLLGIWAAFQTDRLVINQAFLLLLPGLPLLSAVYVFILTRRAHQSRLGEAAFELAGRQCGWTRFGGDPVRGISLSYPGRDGSSLQLPTLRIFILC
jgi:hypothetical protein